MATPGNIPTPKTGTLGGPPAAAVVASVPQKSQRGQNKPKCKQCGNVARSRCPFEACKSCCARNQNPCPIHVLKTSTTVPDKSPSSGAAPLDQKSFEPPPSVSAGRVASLRQLSNSFAQFNTLNLSLRSKKPLNRKDAAAINEWRFSKLKEYKERNIEVENEAFERYMQNVDLLEDVLSVKNPDDNVPLASESNPIPTESNEMMISGLKLQLRSNSMRSDGVRMRIQKIVDEGLKKLQKCVVDGESNDPIDEADKDSKRRKRTEKLSAISDLMDKINKARSEEDLQSCLEMKFQLFNSDEGSDMMQLPDNEMHKDQTADSVMAQLPDSEMQMDQTAGVAMVQSPDNEMQKDQTVESDVAPAKELDYSLPKLVATTEFDQETLNTIDKHFSSLDNVEEL